MINFVTIVLDGMPFIKMHLDIFNKMSSEWHWYIIEGAASNTKDTGWCKPQTFRLSKDGTTEYLRTLRDPRITVIQRPRWENKTSMVNAALANIRNSGVVMQIDSDEVWTAEQLDSIVAIFNGSDAPSVMQFFCRYWLGPAIQSIKPNTYGNNPGEWIRAWKWSKPMRFDSHEPPVLSGNKGIIMDREETQRLGLVFDHYSWFTEEQVKFKESFYGYEGAVDGWKKLQSNQSWPVKLKNFFPWVDDNATADKR